jgi:protein-S-isoprenylcysteine O-methyltransferase Ste14
MIFFMELIMLKFNLTNLCLPFILGYALIWGMMIYVDKLRGVKIEDEEQYRNSGSERFMLGFLPTLVLMIISFFVPLGSGVFLVTGFILYGLGIIIYILAGISFLKSASGLNINGIYCYSRNPMYVGGIIFIAGLNVMSWAYEVINYVFLFLTLVWIVTVHFHVLHEERFLSEKYKQSYEDYIKRVPRYLGYIK